MSKLTSGLFLFTLALAVSVPAQEAAVHTAGTETRVVRVQPAMRHVGARPVVTRSATPVGRVRALPALRSVRRASCPVRTSC